MSDKIPPEDEISKTILWERIDHNRDVCESFKGEVLYQLKNSEESLKTDTSQLNSEHSMLVHKRMKEIEDWLRSFKLEIQRDNVESIKKIEALFKNHLGEVESRLKLFQDSIDATVQAGAIKLFQEGEQRISVIEKEFEDLSKGLNESLSKYQVEIRIKMGELRSKIEKIISHLRDGFQGL